MSDTLVRPAGTGTAGAYVDNTDHFTTDDANQIRILLNKLGFGNLVANQDMGGSKVTGYSVSADGDYDLVGWRPIRLDNRSTQFSGYSDSNGGSLIVQVRFEIRVSDATISATPKLRYASTYGTIAVAGAGTVATISGAAACSATNDDFTGSNQYQTVTVTLPSGANLFKPQITIASTGGNPYLFWAQATLDFYMDSTP